MGERNKMTPKGHKRLCPFDICRLPLATYPRGALTSPEHLGYTFCIRISHIPSAQAEKNHSPPDYG